MILEKYLEEVYSRLISEYKNYVFNADKNFEFWKKDKEAKADSKSWACSFWEDELLSNKSILAGLERSTPQNFYGLKDRWGNHLFEHYFDKIRKLKEKDTKK